MSAGDGLCAEVGVAGVPKYIGASRDYETMFAQLSAAGIDIFFPVFQYQEAPAPATLGHEADFVPPCERTSPAFAALRRHKIRLVVPGGLIYPTSGAFPSIELDPLNALLACAGREAIYGVLGFDEPALNGIGLDASRKLYERVKEIDPSLPVLMVQSPMVIEPGRQDSDAARTQYMEQVRQQSEYADIVGFSLYAIPAAIAKLGSPGHGDEIVDYPTAIDGYMGWLSDNLPGKQTMAVLQSFAYADQFEHAYLTQVAPPEMIAEARDPTKQELKTMAQISIDRGAQLIIWYGSAFKADPASPLWDDVLTVSKALPR
ncbi:hypothetical protein QO002_003236 [Pararhizobium capsulatum DSM 1112]|uniref:Uncharacterized protein n=1 Tax=Pararhizobium capsulatum DSM 1112 TaxID=1121113 RepID=A0ABU0BT14_9HYPH|nr:hypothetical protein [Pararhizobium capsulatum]MDQ0321098.1 hypothetical protein [Pararhizobium capsulatum DSM 1112]